MSQILTGASTIFVEAFLLTKKWKLNKDGRYSENIFKIIVNKFARKPWNVYPRIES
jgi:hypothetical protein